MKKSRILSLAGISLAVALTISCGDHGLLSGLGGLLGNEENGLLGNFTRPGANNLLQGGGGRLGFMSSEEGVPDGDVAVITSVEMRPAVSGFPATLTVTAREELSELYLQFAGDAGGPGFYKWTLEPQDLKSRNPYVYQVDLEINADLQGVVGEKIEYTVSGKTKNGGDEVKAVTEELKTIQVRRGALQISLSWDNNDDIDLHVTTPSGEELYYGNKGSGGSAGELDLDSNVGCKADDPRIENVYFEAPLINGNYVVKIHEYSGCAGRANYNVTANTNGTPINFGGRGTFGSNSWITIGTIRVANGQVQ